jgi:photosystem II stability/assembly factor-like uncharacterized protein
MPRLLLVLSLGLLVASNPVLAQEPETPAPSEELSTATLAGLRLRSIGPATTSGRVVGFAVHPDNPSHYFVAVASGGVWKTTNAGTTWTPLFDGEASYSIGCVTLDPKNPQVVWVGSGENNSQRSVGYGDGVYRSEDGGKSWKNLGLKSSEHIARILIDPRNSNTVFVASQGPLWGPGGERGLFKTVDGGKTWKNVLSISDNTGVTDVVLNPRNPDIMLAATYQRRRHVWTLINGGPESAIHRSTDGGVTWTKIRSGLPTEEMGRIGLALAPSEPDVIYASIESIDKKGGIFRSLDQGVTWEKRNDFDAQAQYYAHIVVDPANASRIYVMNVALMVSDDGGKTLSVLGEKNKHSDNHEIWIDPRNPSHYLVGCDGGIYESYDRGANYRFQANLPVTQFYDVTVDNAAPFYHVYGGTQDNFTLGGPARTGSASGILNSDWFVTQGGDGFHSRVDPKDPNIIYSESQYGGLVRFDRHTNQTVGIQPLPGKGEPPLRWNWDSPLLLSPHSATRIYFAANRIFRSDDRGSTWRAISGDLTRKIDRDTLPVMGKVWGPDAVSKHVSTSFYGNIVALAESPLQEGLLYAGTDDGLIQVTDNGGKTWQKYDVFPAVPEKSYISRLLASQTDLKTVYASFDNHKNADFTPYVLKSNDAGKTWKSIRGNLPANGSVLAIAEDSVDPNLLFVGTEFGLFVSIDGGAKWTRVKSGLPTIAVRDLAIQKQMNDLVIATFGRGIYVLDDYSPLRHLGKEKLAEKVQLFPTRSAQLFIQAHPLGGRGKAYQGSAFYTADNPPYGATFTYYLKKALRTKKQERRAAERAALRKGDKPVYPSKEELRKEEEQEAPAIIFTIRDVAGAVVRTISGSTQAGIHRSTWDLRDPAAGSGPRRGEESDDDDERPSGGPLVLPGKYTVTLEQRVDGVKTRLAGPQEFEVVVYGADLMRSDDLAALRAFQTKLARLQRSANGALAAATAISTNLEAIKRAIEQTPGIDEKWRGVVRELEKKNREILLHLRGDSFLRARNENTPVSILERVGHMVGNERFSLSRPSHSDVESYDIAHEELGVQVAKLRTLLDKEVKPLEKALDDAGAPWTPGRLPGLPKGD